MARGRLITYEDLDIRRDGTILYNGKLKNYHISKNGYLQTVFSGKTHYIHRLVAQKFIPNPENKPTVNHINGVKDDNRVENLEWNTSKENLRHAFKTGLKGMSQLKRRKLTMEQAREIRNKYVPRKYTQQMLADEYGISFQKISRIIRGEIYLEEVS